MTARERRRGYTVVEVMIALAILAIGTSGIIAMQKVTAVGNRDAKNLLIGNQIARTWTERLRADAAQWNHPSSYQTTDDLANTQWIRQVSTNAGQWIRPADSALGSFTADSFGNDVPANDPAATYCTNLRLTWLYGPPAAPPYLLRAEVRVFWLRDGGGGVIDPGIPLCDPTITIANVGGALTNYHFVYVATAIAENMAR
jgi:prepilin-type N-terminal cleavage/methylation domain-containing protein